MRQLKRIMVDPQVMGGKPCIRNLRVTVGTIVGLIGAGRTTEEVLEAYPYLEREDLLEALSYAAWRAEEIEVCVCLRQKMNSYSGVMMGCLECLRKRGKPCCTKK